MEAVNPEDDPPGSAYDFLSKLILPPDPLPDADKPNARKPDRA